MLHRSAHPVRTRLAACFAAAGLFFAATASAQTSLPPPNVPVGAEARQDRIEELERQLREQTAENERVQYELNQAQREITRLRGMVGELAGVNQQLTTPPPSDAAVPPATEGANPAPTTLNGAQRNATGTLGTMPAATPVPSAPRDAGAEYTRARQLLNNGQLAEAEAALSSFLEEFPNAETAADARFWFAFTLAARNNHTDAAANFVQYLQANRNAPRAAEAQVRLGMALVNMGDTRRGCSAFSSLARQYPNAPRNVRDLAAREARAANCAA
ncbi:tetratricopeptide repeat protein [Terricaulis sp.]|uniref:tetratricopeptide repeat protein n=1 Tax=Terricaulis sp. TaxID=2768686 RepID=UPI002ADD8990|nr:tetratricopeptide repeat protein [Terricaulis sp.]